MKDIKIGHADKFTDKQVDAIVYQLSTQGKQLVERNGNLFIIQPDANQQAKQRNQPVSRTLSQPEILARAFSEQLIKDIGYAKVKEVNARNAVETNPDVCASHDFCDANMTMLRAFERVTGKAEHELNFESQAEMDLWNSAWSIAKQNNFFIQ